ncbi:MAG TPA: glutamine-hydrolyzing GMP synthase [Methanocorpusculum sp.]|nr:glutamine-hydrolyzing GMP synthase [Methanocorpusculum sp.]
MEAILVLDFGGQYNQLIARRIREANVYCEVKPCTVSLDEITSRNYMGIIFTGGPASVYAENAPRVDVGVFSLGIPILGICYGAQLTAFMLGGRVASGTTAMTREYGKTPLLLYQSLLFQGIPKETFCWMSHGDYISELPAGFCVTAETPGCPFAALENSAKKIYAVQFHPEVLHTPDGMTMIQNFLFNICGCTGTWHMSSFVDNMIAHLREKIDDKKALCALSGGVDSSVAAVLVHKAIGRQLTCIFVDHGLLRKNEADEVEKIFKNQYDLNLIRVNAESRFLAKLAGVSDPEQKRKIIGAEFIHVFEEEAKKIGMVDFLVQGTIYPDVIESGPGQASVIKSHHNVGGLPDNVDFKEIIEPLRILFKDEVRAAGIELGLPEKLVWRQPFPGPGLAIRVIGDVTKEKLDILRDADAIFCEEIVASGLDHSINQYFAVLTNMRSVGVMGDERTYDYVITLRAVITTDFMTADWAKLPYSVLEKISRRIINEVHHVNRVLYDITSKPPATIEYE